MNDRKRIQPRADGAPNAADYSGGVASGKRQGLHEPSRDTEVADALANVSLKDRGTLMEDHLRDRRGNGVAKDYDDSIETRKD
jgi:hypothetical protein